ncbi:hypothetical protein BJ878DRAFT_484395 [Calycina marina]|uniref:Uncharacterized protein n=1 Tax=Calycina marina TaxID=1763456 RepID=A0A9P8CC33_9HELO|nr:hypothetical protein BJ878DRAFT_484395 [Calycina marina]
MAFVKKQVSDKDRQERVAYGHGHGDKTIEDFWSCNMFTDEPHIDPSSLAIGDILQEQGTRYNDENIMERVEERGSAFHIAAWINRWGKATKLEFYNDEEGSIELRERLWREKTYDARNTTGSITSVRAELPHNARSTWVLTGLDLNELGLSLWESSDAGNRQKSQNLGKIKLHVCGLECVVSDEEMGFGNKCNGI